MSAPILHLPDNISVVSDYELQQLIHIPSLEIQRLNDIHERVTMPPQTYDIESLLHAHKTSLLQEKRSYCFITITTSLCAITIFGILCFLLYSYLRYAHYKVWKPDDATNAPKNPSEPESTRDEAQG